MERRKFVIGLGALASGSAAAVGTGAFSTSSVDRSAQIEIVDDTDALVGLDSDLESDIVTTQSMGGGVNDAAEYLVIDFDVSGGGDGINPNSAYLLGTPPTDVGYTWGNVFGDVKEDGVQEDEHAFYIQNSDTVAHDITVTWEHHAGTLGSNTVFMALVHEGDLVADSFGYHDGSSVRFSPGDEFDLTAENVGQGEVVYVVLGFSVGDYENVEDNYDLSGDITVKAD